MDMPASHLLRPLLGKSPYYWPTDMSLSPRAALYDLGPRLLRDIWTLTGIAIVIVTLRVTAKIKIRKFGWDDILMVSALVSLFTSCFGYIIIWSIKTDLFVVWYLVSCYSRISSDYRGHQVWIRSPCLGPWYNHGRSQSYHVRLPNTDVRHCWWYFGSHFLHCLHHRVTGHQKIT